MQSRQYISQFPFDGRQVRLLLYRECDNRGRRLLFDSNALQKVFLQNQQHQQQQQPSADKNFKNTTTATTTCKLTTSKLTLHNNNNNTNTNNAHKCSGNNNINNNHYHNIKKNLNQCKVQKQQHQTHSKDFVEICNEYGYKKNRNNTTDIVNIGEMVFGALAMSFRGTAFKIHWLEEPARILCSEIFLTPLPSQSSSLCSSVSFTNLSETPRTSISSEHSSLDGLSISSLSLPYHAARHASISTAGGETAEQMEHARPRTNSDDVRSSYHSSTYSMGTDSGYSGLSRSVWSSIASQQYSTDNSSQGSGICSNKSEPLQKLFMNNHGNSFNSNSSLQRRISRNLCTSFENEYSYNDLIGFTNDYSQFQAVAQGGSEGRSSDTHSNPEISRRLKLLPRRAKLGLAVSITLSESFKQEMELFCSEHAALLESMLSRVRAYTEEAYINHKDFVNVMFKIWQDTQQWLNDFFTAPRIQTPVWLSVTTSGSKYSKNVAERFIKELCWLLALADTKDTNFFISTMLTATLTHHLGWVSTVLNETNSSSADCKEAAAAQRAKLLQISQTHPYNALWAQMGDLFGSIGVPPKLSRTIIYGTQKLPVERLLNILTFFIRCSEVRYTVKREIFSKQHIDYLINETQKDPLKPTSSHELFDQARLMRSKTQSQLYDNENNELFTSDCDDHIDENELVRNMKKNEIPNVLAFRDSRFVQQELRIGNFLMDTGIEKSEILESNYFNTRQQRQQRDNERIRLTVTTPENIETYIENDQLQQQQQQQCSGDATDEGKALEAIEIDMFDGNAKPSTNIEKSTCKFMRGKSGKNFFWNIVPHALREGLCLTEQQQQQHKQQKEIKSTPQTHNKYANFYKLQQQQQQQLKDNNEFLLDLEMNEQMKLSQQTLSFTSLSDLITQNSIGKSDRMTWGIEPTKENICLDEQMHFDLSKLIIEREHGSKSITTTTTTTTTTNDNDDDNKKVMFVLGDNEPLINLKRNNKNELQQQPETTTTTTIDTDDLNLCAIHQKRNNNNATTSNVNGEAASGSGSGSGSCGGNNNKKHSGVKFNFEQYPQIATNYMKSKNLVLSHYNLLIDKSFKFSNDDTDDNEQITTNAFPNTAKNNNCRICSSILKTYQTPSNATELEFETDQMHYYTPPPATTTSSQTQQQQQQQMLHTVSSVTSVETLKSVEQHHNTTTTTTTNIIEEAEPTTKSVKSKKLQALHMPIPSIKEVRAEIVDESEIKMRTGFIPSMFLKFCDHYVSDMILQGTCAPPTQWENCLREDLALAARSGALISIPMENVAIIADMERWDVRFISSQVQGFPNTTDHSAPVGMSQLVSTMLETVHAMNNAGISAYDCLSYIESKLHEIYLHSESLATFLLETDFCPLSYITRALNISENDVPLLLSIASVHTPQISRKCGISFR